MEFHRSEFIVESSLELKAYVSKLLDGGGAGEAEGNLGTSPTYLGSRFSF